MDPQSHFCPPQLSCQGNAWARHHPRAEPHGAALALHPGRRTGAATTGTPVCRLHQAAGLLVIVLTLLRHGYPRQAIVAAFELDERAVARW